MKESTIADASLRLLPLPGSWILGRHVEVSGAPGLTDRVRWLSEPDARVEARVAQLLGQLPVGRLAIDVERSVLEEPSLGEDETYRLTRDAGEVHLAAATTWGALHGIATLYQLARTGQLPTLQRLDDGPRFPWRGLLIDVARHFIPLPTLYQVVDGMALLKLNVLHLHLSDDQGFRFGSRVFERLASPEHYTLESLQALVSYAGDRGVRVVPELDVPGHTHSWLIQYPEWALPERALPEPGFAQTMPSDRFGVHEAALNPAAESVYAALAELFAEVASVFPDRYVHMGGDEVRAETWRHAPAVRALMADKALPDVADVQNFFVQRVCRLLGDLGKTPVGWDEVLHRDMPPMVVQNWRGVTTRDRALAQDLDCVVSAPYYLDLFYPVDMHYRFDPEASQADLVALEDDQQNDPRLAHVSAGIEWTRHWREAAIHASQGSGQVLGGEACLWSELVNADTLFVRLWSRLPAVAERLWSAADVVDIDDFHARLQVLFTLPEFDIEQDQRQRLCNLGLAADQVEQALLLEPVKWYARLLGDQALRARIAGREMPQSRPYRVDTPLDRIVDLISPESLSARRLRDLDTDDLTRVCATWAAIEPATWPEDVRPAVAALAEVGRRMAGWNAAGPDPDLEAALQQLYGPHGEYMVAPVPHLLARLQHGSE